MDDKSGNIGLDSGGSEETCWHSGWAEIRVRRSSGNTGWMMRLQNRPHPLSMTHPSSHGIPETELGLLATSISPDDGKAPNEGKNSGVQRESTEEIFLSCEVGSFTDISFLSKAPSSMAAKVQSPVICHVTEEEGVEEVRDAAKRPDEEDDRHIKEDIAAIKNEEVQPTSSRKDSCDDKGDEAVADESVGTAESVCPEAISKEQSEGTSDEKDYGADKGSENLNTTPGMLSIGETAALLQDDFPEDENQGEKIEELKVSDQDTSTQGVTPPVKRSANSHSWSATEGMTSPLPISPRASSYTFSMEYLPPLLSDDGGEEPSHSPSLHDEGRIMSEEEQVCNVS